MKRFNLILLFSFFILIPNVYAEILIPNTFELNENNQQLNPDFDFYGVNNGNMTNVLTLDGNNDKTYRFEITLDGSQCDGQTNSTNCYNAMHNIENGGLSDYVYGSFAMCVSKPQITWSIDWRTCSNNCLQKSNDLTIINESYKSCTLGLYDTETGGTLENDGYLVNVYYKIAKWQYIEGAFSSVVNGNIYLHNLSDSTLYYKFVNDVYLYDYNHASWNEGYGIFNHDYSQPDIGGITFLNNGTCVQSYNQLNVYKYPNNWDRNTDTFTFNNNLNYERLPGGKNLFNNNTIVTGDIRGLNPTIRLSSNQYLFLQPGTYTFSTNLNTSLYNYGITIQNVGVPPLNYYPTYIYDSGWQNSSSLTFTINQGGYFVVGFRKRDNSTLNVNDLDDFYFQLETGRKTSYQPYGGYYIEYDNLNIEMGVFHYYGTNLNEPNNIYVYLEDYEGDTQLFDMVNCKNSYVCKYENYFGFTSEILNLFSQNDDNIKKLKIYNVGNKEIYFENPYLFDLYSVPGHATWKEYYQPYGQYICGDNENGTFYNAQNKKVYYNPDNPPKIVSSNPNGQAQNIFGIEVNFYGLSGLFSIPIQIYNDIKNGNYNTCRPLVIPFPYFSDKNLTIPCMTSYVYNLFPELLTLYRVIMYGVISLKIGIGTIQYIKKWYDGTIEGGD